MKIGSFVQKPSKSFFAKGLCLAIGLSVAAMANADWRDTTLPKIEAELLEQSKFLSQMSETWATEVKSRVDFAVYKIRNARLATHFSVENTHLNHACEALKDERALLMQAQLQTTGSLDLLDKLIDETFAHREGLGCRE